MMKISKSKFVKSAISILLVVMMLLSAGMSSIIAATVDMASESANVDLAETGAGTTTVYLQPNDNWKKDRAHFYVYSEGSSGNTWSARLTDDDNDGVYKGEVPSDNNKIIFVRYNPDKNPTNDAWNGKWNQTSDLKLSDSTGKKFVITDWGAGNWQVYPSSAGGTDTPSTGGTASKYTLRGDFNGWSDSKNKFMTTADSNVITCTLDINSGTYGFKITDGSTWYGNTGTIEDTTTTTSATGWDFSSGAGNCTFKASGGTYTFTFNTSTNKLTVKKAEEKVTATFNNWDNSLIEAVEVTKGSTPTPPSDPEREGYTFTGWSPAVGAINADTTYTAVYTPKNYTLTFKEYDGLETLHTQTAAYDSIPVYSGTTPSRSGYTFLGWAETANASEPTIGTGNTFPAVSEDKTYYAVYIAAGETVTVTTDHTEGGTVYGGGNYASGTEVTLKATPDTGYVFTSWEISSGATLSSGYSLTDAEIKLIITGNVTVKANFTEQTASSYYLRGNFPDIGWDSGMNMTYTEEKVVSCTLTLDSGTYEFKIYDGTSFYGNNGTIKDTTTITSSNGWEFSKDNNNNCKLEATGGKYTFTFYTDTKRLIVERAKLTSTVTVYGTDGSVSGAGTTTFKEGQTVVSTVRNGNYAEAEVKPNEYFTICTQIKEANNTETNLKYEWYVKGYVIKGKEFVEANSLGNGIYGADIRLSADYEKADIVPIYFHTQAYLDLYGIDTTTFYAVIPDGIENWTGSNNYIGAYTWFYNPETEAVMYEPFGKYPGQLMIPSAGNDKVYYTIVETSAPTKVNGKTIYVDGVTLTNYYNTFPSNGSQVNVQTYDYYEFVSYTLDGLENITFVLKDHNKTNYNKLDISGTSPITPGSFTFDPFVNYNNEITDIFGNVMTKAQYEAQVEADNFIHVVRIGNKNYKGESHTCNMKHGEDGCPLDGQWYVDAYIYDNNGNFITKGHSYQLSNGDLDGDLAPYEGYAVKVSYEKNTVVNNDGGDEDNKHDATRWDGEWYADADINVTVDISVNVALSTDDGKTFDIEEDDQGKLNVADYGKALVNDSASVSVTRGSKVSLVAQAYSGYRFIGWANADGKIFSNNISETVDAAIATSYTAVYQKLKDGQFYLNHYIYMGEGTADKTEIPDAHNGRGDLYVQIEKLDVNGEVIADTGLLKQNSVNLAATQGEKLRITIATDPAGIDTFFAWYVNAIGLTGTTYEEVGVDSRDNLAMPGPGNAGKYTNPNTVIGETGLVYFQFYHTVDKQFNLTLYSDIIRVTSNKKLIYRYNDRNMGVKEYVVNYELTPDEIVGFEGNKFRPYTPSDATITKFAPFVGDYYKDVDWVISEFSADECVLWGKNSTKLYDITSNIAGFVSTQRAPYNSVVNYDASELGFTSGGFWYKDINKNSTYDAGVDPIIANGTTYSYRVTDNISIGYVSEKVGDFTVSVDNPVYGREQHTDGNGNNKSDKVVVDYMVNMVTPYVYGDGSGFTPWYNDKQVTDNWSGQMVTIESLEKAGYTVSFGVLLEQVDLNYVVPEIEYPGYDFLTFEEALADAQNNGYGKATENVDEILNNMTGTTMAQGGKYYINYNRTDAVKLTNKNRYLFTIELDNTLDKRAAFYNVYAYMTVTSPEGVATTYISNVQTLNIHTMGTTNIA